MVSIWMRDHQEISGLYAKMGNAKNVILKKGNSKLFYIVAYAH